MNEVNLKWLHAYVWSQFYDILEEAKLWSSKNIDAEKAMTPHSSTLAWKIPQTEEPGRLQSTGSLRVGHDWETSLSLFTSCIGEGNGNPLECSRLENPRDSGTWLPAVYGVAQSQTRLKRFSSSSSSSKNIDECQRVGDGGWWIGKQDIFRAVDLLWMIL